MQKKNLFMALAVPAVFAACSQEEMALAPENAQSGFQGKPLTGVTIGFNKAEGADTKMANDGWNLKWAKGDQVGLVWTNAHEITSQLVDGYQYNPEVFPKTASWGSNTRMTCTNPDGNVFEMQDGQVMEGQYFAYYPYQEQTYQVNKKFGVAVDQVQHQLKVTTANPDDNLSYVKKNMVWVSRAYAQDGKPDAGSVNDATLLYFLGGEQAGMSKSIDITMNRFANMLDTRIKFDSSNNPNVTIDPANVVIEKVVLKTVRTYDDAAFNLLAVDGSFDMSKLIDEYNNPYGLDGLAGDKGRIQLKANSKVFTSDEENQSVNAITVVIDNPEKVADNVQQRVNFLMLPKLLEGNYGGDIKLQLEIYTNYGVATVDEGDWLYSTGDDLTGLEVWGPNTQPGSSRAPLANAETSNWYKGWSKRVGAHFTRWISVNVADLKWETRCVSNQSELVEAIRQYNETGLKQSEMMVCVDVKNLQLNNFDYSVNSNYPAVQTFIKNGNTLVIDDKDGHYKDGHYTDAEHKITWKGNSTIGAEILTDFQENVAENATLNVTANHRVNGGMVADATSILNIEPDVTLTLGAEKTALNPFELNGTVNVKAGDSKLGKLLIGSRAKLTNNGTIELFGTLTTNTEIANTKAINLYTTAKVEGQATIENSGLVNYYYAKANNLQNFIVINGENGQYLAVYDDQKVPNTNDTKEIAFLNEANASGVTHYVISKTLYVESQTVNMSNAESIIVNGNVDITANPSNTATWLNATKAILCFRGVHNINVSGSYANTAKFQVKDIVMGYGAALTNNAIIEQGWNGTFTGETNAEGKVLYTVNNVGKIYGGKYENQAGTVTWGGNKYGVQ